ncbi:hypothetical protein [Miltoncostaea marina]|uniref:hypothetical protein n=1 Tax=Miltoncostaea marina TaxID=2843215 RepID=UPI001C3D4FB5|nr:hypothetical protein [Miltoncostaea marina]
MNPSEHVPRILPLGQEETAPDGARFAPLHVVSGERHHIGWFRLTDDPWRVGLVEAGAVVDAGVAEARVRAVTEALLDRLRAADAAGDDAAPAPVGPVGSPLRLRVDRRRAIARLEAELRDI